ncbi:MAG: sulfite exporter TauE/SafE family protein [Oscillospiraceae bacterium]|nr:sulfite exporter TauE/SafE family protein [Oscillospiraceae bacterium]
MVSLICYIVTFFACVLGTICGMGGGIIIKPALDATGVMAVSVITFLSGCTVIAMSCWNVTQTLRRKESVLDLKNTPLLALGAAVGGLMGKEIYHQVAGLFADQNTAGGVQAGLLFTATLATLIYTCRKDKLKSKQIKNPVISVVIGLLLGILGAFLGIGGGPFNVAVLTYFFSMPTKKATQNSLLIVLFSQTASTLKTILSSGMPALDPIILIGMVLLGIAGSEVGRRINKRIDNRQATLCLEGAMLLILAINVYNMVQFFT